MCYLVAKDENKHGSYALKTTHGAHLAEFKEELDAAVEGKGIELVVISRPTAYGEYAPYTFAETEEEFREMVQNLKTAN